LKSLYNKYIYSNIGTIKKLFSLLIVFGIFKSLAFIAPLGIQEVLNSDKLYGEFEYRFNLGQTLTGIFSMGLVGAYGYFILKTGQKKLIPIFHFHFLALTALLCLITVLFPSLIANTYFGAAILGVAFADQILISGILKINGFNKWAVVIDTGVYIIMGTLVLLALSNTVDYSKELWHSAILFCLVATSLLFHLNRAKNFNKISRKDILSVYKFGGLVLIIGPLLVLVTSSTRLYIEHYTTFAEVGVYSYYFRLASFILIIFRVFGIMLFKKFFIENHQKLDRVYSLIMIGLFLLNTFMFFILPMALEGRYAKFDDTFETHSSLFLLCMFQITFWINVSLFEPIFQRENKLLWLILLLISSIAILIVAFYIFNMFDLLTLNAIVIINTVVIYLLFFGQQMVLKKAKVSYPRTTLAHIGIGVVYSLALLFEVF